MLKPNHKIWLEKHFPGQVVFDEPMSRHTTFGIGGPATIITVRSDKELQQLVQWAREKEVPTLILGAGSNLLVRDSGIDGLVVKLANGYESIAICSGDLQGPHVSIAAGAGVPLRRLGKFALDHALAGVNFMLGIPGTVGGAIRMNAGAWGRCIADSIVGISVLNKQGEVARLGKDQLSFSYRKLSLEEGTVIIRGEFFLKKTDRETLRKEAAQMQKERANRQPLSLPSAGSVFRNPEGFVSAGELIEKAGMKGMRCGQAEVSVKHANFIVNRGNATATDVLTLMGKIQQTIYQKYGVQLEPEVTIVG